MQNSETRFSRSEDAAWRILDGSAVIVTPHDGMIHQLNETGTWIWEKLDSPRTAVELASMLAVEFDVDRDTADSHVREFLASLSEKRIVNPE